MLPAGASGSEESSGEVTTLRLTRSRLTPYILTCFVLKSSTHGGARHSAYGVTKVRQMLRPKVAADK